MSRSLWPNFASLAVPRGMTEMLYDAASDIGVQTNGAIDFYVDAVGLKVSGAISEIRHNCYLRVVKTGYTHLLFRVTTPVVGPFPAVAATPEGEEFPDLKDESELRGAIEKILRRERTKEIVLYLLHTNPK
ncbi:MAG TPA: hypothetical protein VIK18_04750 [Pirellulales bacterium]